ncbi:MAG: alpha/beta fold hydrolase [Pseudomonadota bacterium]
MSDGRKFWAASTAVLLCALIWLIVTLETERATVERKSLQTPAGGVSLYLTNDPSQQPLVLIAHGFAGSAQMMQTIARDLARAGFTTATFDYIGHGRHPGALSADVSDLNGTTAQLVEQSRHVLAELRAHIGAAVPLVLLGHSMATDIQIRAAQADGNVAAVVAISMYSDAITPTFPERLLVLSGQWEDRLRAVGLEAVRQIDADAGEGETVQAGNVLRRATYVPRTEHVAVLYSRVALLEIRVWLAEATGLDPVGMPQSMGVQILAVLGLTVVTFVTGMRAFGPPPLKSGVAMSPKAFAFALLLPAGIASATNFAASSAMGFAGFGALALFLSVWGAVALALCLRASRRLGGISVVGLLVFLAVALGFALALDRYGAAFLPAGPRIRLFFLLLPGAFLFMLADRALLQYAPLWQRIMARALPIAFLLALMLARPQVMGLLFTVLPVLILFHLVYSTLARSIADRFSVATAGVGAGICLAWALSASTPLFAG